MVLWGALNDNFVAWRGVVRDALGCAERLFWGAVRCGVPGLFAGLVLFAPLRLLLALLDDVLPVQRVRVLNRHAARLQRKNNV